MGIAFGKTIAGKPLRFWLTFVGLGITLAACGRFAYERREPWREELEARCMKSGAVEMSRYVQMSKPINGPGACGMDYPLKVSAVSNGRVGFNQPQTLACPMVPTIDRWVDNDVQPAAFRRFGAYIAEVKAGSYSCRGMVGGSRSMTSEHAFGNALDVFAFVLTDGRTVTVRDGWKSRDPQEQAFLRDIFIQACEHFTTVLGPGYNQFHYDHFHLDLARHDAQWQKHLCNPRPDSLRRAGPEVEPPTPQKRWLGIF